MNIDKDKIKKILITGGSGSLWNQQYKEADFVKEQLLEFDLSTLRSDQLAKLFFRCLAALKWKKGDRNSANALVKGNKSFLHMREVWSKEGGTSYEEETIASWISDMSPRSKK